MNKCPICQRQHPAEGFSVRTICVDVLMAENDSLRADLAAAVEALRMMRNRTYTNRRKAVSEVDTLLARLDGDK